MMLTAWETALLTALNGLRVTPNDPPGRVTVVPTRETAQEKATSPDASSSWSAFITYEDANGELSQRTITFRKISMLYDRPETINAYCHKRKAYRSFRVDRISEFVCVETGEVLDPGEHLLDLYRKGALKIDDKNLTRLITILTFMGRCDGYFDVSEKISMQESVERYARFFGSTDDASIERALSESKRIAPSSGDLVRAIGGIVRSPESRQLAKFTWESCVRVIDADGVQHPDELRWALQVRDALGIDRRA